MTSFTYDPFKFSHDTNSFQKQAYEAAIAKTQEIVKTKENIKTFSVARKICKEAFEIFKNNMQATFPDPSCKDLVEITISSRETIFFVELNEKITSILKSD